MNITDINITDIIGKDKAFAPPLTVKENPEAGCLELQDANGAVMLSTGELTLTNARCSLMCCICEMLNKEYDRIIPDCMKPLTSQIIGDPVEFTIGEEDATNIANAIEDMILESKNNAAQAMINSQFIHVG